LHVTVAAFFAHVSYALASFFGFAANGSVAAFTQAVAPLFDEQPSIAESVFWQLESLPHAAACFEQFFSMHFPQSVLPSDGVEGGGASSCVLAGAGAAGGDVSAAAAPDGSDAAALALSEPDGGTESDAAEPSAAGVSAGGGLDPPQANQERGTATMRRRAAEVERWWARSLLGMVDSIARRVARRAQGIP
jgi:hypothetical protein